MIAVLLMVRIALTFGFVFAKLDSITKSSKILQDEVRKIQSEIAALKDK